MGLLGGGNAFLRLTNVGSGPALAVDLRIVLEPDGPEKHWTTAVVAVNEHHDFIPSPDEPNGLLNLDALTADFERYLVRGRCRDAMGEWHIVEETLDVRADWEALKASHVVQPTDYAQATSDSVKRIAAELAKWTDGIRGIQVFTTDKAAHERQALLRMSFDSVSREHAGASPDVVREALRTTAARFGQILEPPEEWVDAISRDDDEGFVFRVPAE